MEWPSKTTENTKVVAVARRDWAPAKVVPASMTGNRLLQSMRHQRLVYARVLEHTLCSTSPAGTYTDEGTVCRWPMSNKDQTSHQDDMIFRGCVFILRVTRTTRGSG